MLFSVDNLDVEEAVEKTLFVIENGGEGDGGSGILNNGNIFNELFTNPGPGTYKLPGTSNNVYQIQPKIIGGGGGGGYGITGAAGGGGGGGASYDTNLINAVINFGILNQPFKARGGTTITYTVGEGGKGGNFSTKTNATKGTDSSINYEVLNPNDLSLLLLPITCPGGNPGQNGQTGGIGGEGGAGGAELIPNILLNEGPRGNFYTDKFSISSTGAYLNFSKTGGFLSNNGVLATGPNLIIDKDPLNSESIINLFGTFNNSSATGTVLFKYFVDDIEEATNEVPLQNISEEFDINEIISFNQYEKLSIQASLTGSTESFTGYIECKINSPLISGDFETSPTGLPTGPIYTPLSFGNPTGIFVGITGPTGSAGFTTIKFTGDSIINVGVEYNVVSSQTGYFQMALAIGNTGIFESEILTSGTGSNFNYRVNVKNGDVLSVLFRQPTNITGTTQNMTGYFNYDINSSPIKLENGITGFSGLLNFNLSAGGGGGGGSVLGGDGGNGVTIPILKGFLDANPNLLDEILELTPQTIASLIDSGSSMLEGAGVNLDIIDLIQIILLQGGLPGNNNFGNFIKYLANTFNFISPISFNGGNGGGIVDAGAGGSGNKNFLGGGGGGGFGGGYGGNILSKNGTSTNIYGSGGGGGSSNNGNGGDGANGSISLLITKIQ